VQELMAASDIAIDEGVGVTVRIEAGGSAGSAASSGPVGPAASSGSTGRTVVDLTADVSADDQVGDRIDVDGPASIDSEDDDVEDDDESVIMTGPVDLVLVESDGLPPELAWQERALCAQTDPEAFFPEKGGSTREAKRVCMSCEVRAECLDYALAKDERFGIWGGLSERERRRVKKQAV
jgi:WhiB family transcriptional regulator, redox-sensing transcriptional regulator